MENRFGRWRWTWHVGSSLPPSFPGSHFERDERQQDVRRNTGRFANPGGSEAGGRKHHGLSHNDGLDGRLKASMTLRLSAVAVVALCGATSDFSAVSARECVKSGVIAARCGVKRSVTDATRCTAAGSRSDRASSYVNANPAKMGLYIGWLATAINWSTPFMRLRRQQQTTDLPAGAASMGGASSGESVVARAASTLHN